MKKRVPKKTAQARSDSLRNLQTKITGEELAFFVGRKVDVLVEELIPAAAEEAEADPDPSLAAVPASRIALGRAWFQAPEVDGAVVLQFEEGRRDRAGKPISPGSVVEAVITAVNGVDVEAVVK